MTTSPDAHPADLTVTQALDALRTRRLTASALVDASLERITSRNGGEPSFDGAPDAINAWVRIYADEAREQAERADRQRAEGSDAPLLGLPIAVKDIIAIGGHELTASSRHLERNTAASDSAVWRALSEAGAIAVGHTHTHEFAAGGTTDQVGNPWNLAHSPGGSSGGSGAALAAGMVPAALGTDTAGSVRIPAALNGVSGFKPSWGRVPLEGVIPLATSLDHVGPLARTLEDCAVLLETMTAGARDADPWGVADGTAMAPMTAPSRLDGVRIAMTDRPDAVEVAPGVLAGLERAREALESLGAETVRIPAPEPFDGGDYDTVLLAEMRAYHARFAANPERYRDSTREFVDPGATPFSVDTYLEAQRKRLVSTETWQQWMRDNGIAAILEPTTATTAPTRGHGYDGGRPVGGTDPLICFTATWDWTGFPAASLPAGLDEQELPVGVSLVGGSRADADVLGIGIALQRVLEPPRLPFAA